MTRAPGTKARDRECVGEIGKCVGGEKEVSDCFTGDCPKWSEWKDATECPVSCGGGLKKIVRECYNGYIGQIGCTGEYEQVIDCNNEECPKWNFWSEWSECTVTCGGGTRYTRRKCLNGNKGQDGCKGDDLRFEPCNNSPCVYWEEWSDWGECQSSCADLECVDQAACDLATKNEQMYRYRNCINGNIGEGGCSGSRVEGKPCEDLPPCDQWQQWSQWSDCSQTCRLPGTDGGRRIRSRGCDSLIREDPADRLCPGKPSEVQSCSSFPCTVTNLVFDAIDEAICEPKYSDQPSCGKGFLRVKRECTIEEKEEGECLLGHMVENRECDLGACKQRRTRPSDFVSKTNDFSDALKSKLRELSTPIAKLKYNSGIVSS